MIEAVLYQNYLIEETVAKKMSHKKRFSPDVLMHILKRKNFYSSADFYEIWRHITLI